MRICIVGKFPPIEGGVSMLNYRYAHALARRGHEVHVVTNAGEVRAPYRMFMRDEDWARCDGDYGAGSVRVHWTDPYDREQWHIPTANPFITKLASIGGQVCAEHDIEAVFSFYLEPYGVAGHLVAQMAGLPHVVKTAGSDAGRLWSHRQFGTLYDHIFKSAAYVVAGGTVSKGLNAIGVPPHRVRPDGDFRVPDDLFGPVGPVLDIDLLCRQIAASPEHAALRQGRVRDGMPYIGVYGKLGNSKGTLALLRAVARLIGSGTEVGLLVMGHEPPKSAIRFRDAVARLSLDDHVVQLPFLPHWRVPEFIRRCAAVCCLEQDFPIAIHTPIMAREVLCCGTPLIASTEMIGKLPQSRRLVNGYNCFAVGDVNDTDGLADKIRGVLSPACDRAAMGRRGREFVLEIQSSMRFPERLERTLELAASGGEEQAPAGRKPASRGRFVLTRLALGRIDAETAAAMPGAPTGPGEDFAWAESILSELSRRVASGSVSLAPLRDAVKFDVCLARAAAGAESTAAGDRLFRLQLSSGAGFPADIGFLVPTRLPSVVVHRFDHDVNAYLDARATHALPAAIPRRGTCAVFLTDGDGRGIRTIVLDEVAGRLLDLCDGELSVAELLGRVAVEFVGRPMEESWVAESVRRFFEIGLIGLRDRMPAAAVA